MAHFAQIIFLSILGHGSHYIGEWTSPPTTGPSTTTVDGPLLGNGDIGAFVSGSYTNLTFYLGKNDFWYFGGYQYTSPNNNKDYHNKILGLGGITFLLKDDNNKKSSSNYYLQQNCRNGSIQFNIGNISGKATISQSSSTPNIMMIIFDNIKSINSKLFCLPHSVYASTHYGIQNGIKYCQRIVNTTSKINVTATIAYSSKYLNDSKQLLYVLNAVSNFNIDANDDIIANATQNVIKYLDKNKMNSIYMDNERLLSEFWNLGNISIPNEPLIESYWYKSLYLQYMANRKGRFAPGLWGPWISTDYTGWNGDYTLNYNFEASYYGIYTANRIAIADPYYETIMDYTRNGESITDANNYGCNGIHYPAHIAPLGFNNSFDWGQHSSASFAALNFIQHFKHTYDHQFMTKNNYEFYRFLYNITEWWLCWTDLSFDDTSFHNEGGYVDNMDCTREGCDPDRIPLNVNPAISLSFMQYIVDNLLNITYELGVNTLVLHEIIGANKTGEWIKMSASISPIPIGLYNNTVVLLPQSVPYYFKEGDNPLQFYPIHPGNQIGYGSSPQILIDIARDTINKTNTWLQSNCLPETYPAAVRCGYDINVILKELNNVLKQRMPPNGYVKMGGGGLDSSGAILAINEMLLMSWDGIMRFFVVYNCCDAAFNNLRSIGAFLVSAQMVNAKIVSPIYIFSEKGNWCNFELPREWNVKDLKICSNNCTKVVEYTCSYDDKHAYICSFDTNTEIDYELFILK